MSVRAAAAPPRRRRIAPFVTPQPRAHCPALAQRFPGPRRGGRRQPPGKGVGRRFGESWLPANPPRGASGGPRNPPGPATAEGQLRAAAWLELRFDEASDFPACPWPPPAAFTQPPSPSLPLLCHRALTPFFHCHRQRLMGCVVKILGSINASARH